MPILLVVGPDVDGRAYQGLSTRDFVVTSAQGWSYDENVRRRRFDKVFVEHGIDPRYEQNIKELKARCVRPATEIEALRERIAALEAKLAGK